MITWLFCFSGYTHEAKNMHVAITVTEIMAKMPFRGQMSGDSVNIRYRIIYQILDHNVLYLYISNSISENSMVGII